MEKTKVEKVNMSISVDKDIAQQFKAKCERFNLTASSEIEFLMMRHIQMISHVSLSAYERATMDLINHAEKIYKK